MFCQIDSIDRQLDTIFLFGMFVVYKLTETRNRNIKKRKQETIIIKNKKQEIRKIIRR